MERPEEIIQVLDKEHNSDAVVEIIEVSDEDSGSDAVIEVSNEDSGSSLDTSNTAFEEQRPWTIHNDTYTDLKKPEESETSNT